MNLPAAGLVALLAVSQASAGEQDVVEPRTGVAFAAHRADMSLLGVGVRTKTVFRVKVYAIGLYVADAALAGPLAAHKGQLDSPAFYRDLVWGDFGKQIHMRFVRSATKAEVQAAFRESLPQVNPARLDEFAAHFVDTRKGDEWDLRWAPGGALETSFAGKRNPPIPDKEFAAAVFGIWLREYPIQADLKRDLVSRAPLLIGRPAR